MHRMQLQHRRRVAVAAILAAAAVPGGTSAASGMPEPESRAVAVNTGHAAQLSLVREQRATQAAAVDVRPVRSLRGVPAANAPSGSAGFDWADAGIGAGLVLAMASVGGVVLTGRRRGLAH